MTSALAASPSRIALAAADKVARPARQIGVTIAAAAILPPQLAIFFADLVRRLCEPAQCRLVASFAAFGGGRTSLADGVVHHHWRARPNCGRLACLVFGCSVAQSSLIPARHADRLWPMIPFMGTQGHGKAAKPAARLLRQAPGGTPTNRLKARLKAASDP